MESSEERYLGQTLIDISGEHPSPSLPYLPELETIITNNLITPNLTISSEQISSIITGLQAFKNRIDDLGNVFNQNNDLPTITNILASNFSFTDQSIGDILNVSQSFNQGLLIPVQNYFNSTSVPNTRDLLNLIRELPILNSPDAVDIEVFTNASGSLVDLNIKNLNLHLTSNDSILLDIEEENKLKIEGASINLNSQSNIDLDFGFDLVNNNNQFFIKLDAFTVATNIDSTISPRPLNIGVLEANIKDNGNINLTSNLSLQLNDPNSDNKITVAELQTSLDTLVRLTTQGSANVDLAIDINNANLDTNIRINDSNIFDKTSPSIDIHPFTDLQQELLFRRNNDVEQVILALNSLGNILQSSTSAFNLEGDFPFLNEGMESIVNFHDIISNIGQNLISNSIISPQNFATFTITSDAEFQIKLANLENPIHVVLSATATQNNTNLIDLVADINQALRNAGLKEEIRAVIAENKLLLETLELAQEFSILNPNPTTQNYLGFLPEVESVRNVFNFNTIWNLVDILPNTNSLVIDIDINADFIKDLNLDFERSIQTQIGELTFLGNNQGNIEGNAQLNLRLILNLDSLDLTTNTPLSLPVENPQDNDDDLRIILRNSRTEDFDLKNLNNHPVQDLLNLINNRFGSNLTIAINPNTRDSFLLTDHTQGDNQFRVETLHNSLAGFQLGILGFDSSGTIISPVLIPSNLITENEPIINIPLSRLNNGQGVRDLEQLADFEITLRDGSRFTVDLTGLSTIGQVINKINDSSKLEDTPRVQASLYTEDNSTTGGAKLMIIDQTLGAGKLIISAINGSRAGLDLGILGQDVDGVIKGNSIVSNTLSRHLLIGTDSNITVNVDVSSNNIDLSAALGLLRVGVENGTANFNFGANAQFNHTISNPLGVTLNELLLNADGIINPTYSTDGNVHLPLVIQGLDSFGLNNISPQLDITLSSLASEPFHYDYSIIGLDNLQEELNIVSQFSTDNLLQLINQGIELLRSGNTGFFNEPIPILDKSINELLDFLQPIQEAYDSIQDKLENLKSNLTNSLDDLREQLLNPTLFSSLTPNLQQQLDNGIVILTNAVRALPTSGLSIINNGIPSELIASLAPLQHVISQLPSAGENDLKHNLDQAIAALPSTIDKTRLNQAKDIFYADLNNPTSFPAAFDQLKIAVNQIIGVDTTNALRQLNDILVILQQSIPNGVGAVGRIESTVNNLGRVIDNLPEGISRTALNSAKNELIAALDPLDVSRLESALVSLSGAITNIIPVDLTGISTILSQFAGNFVKDAFEKMLDFIPSQAGIEEFLRDILHADQVALSFATNNSLTLAIDWNQNLTRSIPLNFGASIDNDIVPISFTENGTIDITFGQNISLDFGVQFNSSNVSYFILPSSQISLTAQAESNNFQASARVSIIEGILGDANPSNTEFSLKNGSQPISFNITLSDPNNDGKIVLSELPRAITVITPTGELNLNLPLSINGIDQGAFTGHLDFSNPLNFTITPPAGLIDILNGNVGQYLSFEPLIVNLESFLDSLENKLIDQVLNQIPLIGDNLNLGSSFISKIRETFLSDELKDYLRNSPDPVQDKLNRLGQAFDAAYDGAFSLIPSNISFISFNIPIRGAETWTSDFALDLDVLGLSLSTQGQVNLGLSYNTPFDLVIGLDVTKGFYVEIPDQIDFALSVSLSDATLEGQLFALTILAEDGVVRNQQNLHTGLNANISIDIAGDRNNDGKLTINELSTFSLDPTFNLSAEARLALHIAGILGDNDDLPSIEGNLIADISYNSGNFNVSNAGLYDIQFNVGGFLGGLVSPVLKTIDTYFEPIRPVLNYLYQEVPIISTLAKSVGLGRVTTMDLLKIFTEDDGQIRQLERFIEVVQGIDGVLQGINDLVELGGINLGDYIFSSQSYNFIPNAPTRQSLPSGLSALKNLDIKIPILDSIWDDRPEGIDTAGILRDYVVPLILGNNVTLITWDLPEVTATYQYFQMFPIFPPYPVFLTIEGGGGVSANLSLGLDTSGLSTGNILHGLYFSDEEPAFTLFAYLAAGVELNIVVAAVGAQGGVRCNFMADWHDPNNDGKVYYDEILSNARGSWLDVFDFPGRLDAFLRAYLKIGLQVFGRFITLYRQDFNLFNITLLDFGDRTSSSSSTETLPTLGHYSTGEDADAGIEEDALIIHIGRFADLRQPGTSVDTAEEIYITSQQSGAIEVHYPFRTDYQSRSVDPAPTGSVHVFGDDPDEPMVRTIYIDAGDYNDRIHIDDLVNCKVIVIGGSGNDTIIAGSGEGLIAGGAGNDLIYGSSVNDTLIGGVFESPTGADGEDTIYGGGGANVIFGDNGRVTTSANGSVMIESWRLDDGDDDLILIDGTDSGNDTILGGKGSDRIESVSNNPGDDIILGDHGRIERFNGQVTQITTENYDGYGADDFIVAGIGSDTVLGGAGSDRIINSDNIEADLFLGDQGRVSIGTNTVIESLSAPNDGQDTLLGEAGNDTILGGGGNDSISGVAGEDVLFGDHGKVVLNGTVISLIESSAFDNGGNDTLDAGLNRDWVVGGGANDLVLNQGDDAEIFFGDQGRVSIGTNTVIESLSAPNDGQDTLLGEAGNDTILGGGGNDSISGVAGEDVLFGDHGKVVLNGTVISLIESSAFDNGGNDTILAGVDADTVLGGASNDLITNVGDTSPDILYGDQGYWNATTISNVTDPHDGDDQIFSEGGNDIILGGGGKDSLESSLGLDIVLGDHGIVTRNTTEVIRIETRESDSGDNDTILAGNDDDTVFGGPKDDLITGDTSNNGDDILIGDQGYWTPEVIVAHFDSTSNVDGADTITGNGGNDTLLGNNNRDYLRGNQGLDIIIGDYGIINHTGKVAQRIDTQEVTLGHDDFINGDENNDTLLGGTASDSIQGGADAGRDIIIGDNGTVVNNDGTAQSNDIFSHSPLYGGIDRIVAGAGDDTVIGGSGGVDTTNPRTNTFTGQNGDAISGNEGNDILLGDNAYITRNNQEQIEKIAVILPNYGGDDYILGNVGLDSLVGGFGKDSMLGGDQEDILYGDNALFDYLVDNNINTLDQVISTDVLQGGRDTLHGELGNDLLVGGTDGDSIRGGAGNDLLLGDHAQVSGQIALSALPLNQVTPPFTFSAIATRAQDLGGSDYLNGNDGDDIIFGQQGSDNILGEDGNDDLIGGHNIPAGSDGGDNLDGGTGWDVLAGDNASITRRTDQLTPLARVLQGEAFYDAEGLPLITAASQPDPRGIPGHNIILFDQSTNPLPGTFGNDNLVGGANHDQLFGQMGNDRIRGDGIPTQPYYLLYNHGDDYIEGGAGQDTLYGDLGQDDIIGGSSSFFGTPLASDRPDGEDVIYGGTGAPLSSRDIQDIGSRMYYFDADVILGDNGQIFRLVGKNGSNTGPIFVPNHPSQLARVFQFLDYNSTGNLGGADTISGASGNDEIYGMTGDDNLWLTGGGTNNSLYGGVGRDVFSFSYVENYIPISELATAMDFVRGEDRVSVSHLNLNDWADLQLLISNDGQNNTLLTVYLNGQISRAKINGINPSLLLASDFILNSDNANQTITGTDGADHLFAGLGDDTIRGGAGNDTLFGEAGNDRLEGGTANDYLYGGLGNDIFVFSSLEDNFIDSDVVADFVRGEDKIDVSNLNISDWNTLRSLLSNDSQNNALITIISEGRHYQIKINGINAMLLEASDFIFSTNTANQRVRR